MVSGSAPCWVDDYSNALAYFTRREEEIKEYNVKLREARDSNFGINWRFRKERWFTGATDYQIGKKLEAQNIYKPKSDSGQNDE